MFFDGFVWGLGFCLAGFVWYLLLCMMAGERRPVMADDCVRCGEADATQPPEDPRWCGECWAYPIGLGEEEYEREMENILVGPGPAAGTYAYYVAVSTELWESIEAELPALRAVADAARAARASNFTYMEGSIWRKLCAALDVLDKERNE